MKDDPDAMVIWSQEALKETIRLVDQREQTESEHEKKIAKYRQDI